MPEPKYRIEFSIKRRMPGDVDFTEIGFGGSGDWPDLDAAQYEIDSCIQRREWETTAGMPDPEDTK